MISAPTLLFALLGGILPALLWLWFWLREDKKCPEPRGLILIAFLAGMVAVPLVIPFQKHAAGVLTGSAIVVSWAIIEELFKFGIAYLAVLRNKEMNEPIDAVIYMITVALGFAALENTLFLLEPISGGFVVESIFTGNLRFVGATLIHTLSSAAIGLAIAFSFYKKLPQKKTYITLGVILAIALHGLFNFFIMGSDGSVGNILYVFLFVWIGIIALILLLERIKRITKPR